MKITKHLFISSLIFGAVLSSCSFEQNSSSSASGETSSSSETISETSSSYFSSSSIDVDGLWDNTQDYLRSGTRNYSFYNLNDFHGSVEQNLDNMEVGISYISNYLKSEQNNNPETGYIFTNSGDMWQGSADSNITRGKLVIDWLNSLDCKAQAIGNHEFDWTVDTIEENSNYMDFPLLGCNVIDTNTNEIVEWLEPFETITVNGLHIGIIGAIGQDLESSILQSCIQGIEFVDPVDTVKEISNFLRLNGADFILFLHHDNVILEELYGYVDLVFNGHSHTKQNELIQNVVPVLQAYCNGRDISKCSISYDFTKNLIIYDYSNTEVVALFEENLTNDIETDELYQYYLDNYINDIKNEVVGYTDSGISRDEIASLCAKYMYEYYFEQGKNEYIIHAATTNSSRAEIGEGNITYGDLYKSLPFDNMLEVIKIKYTDLNYYKNFSGYYYSNPSASQSEYVYVVTIDYLEQKFVSYGNECLVVDSYPIYPRDLMKEYISRDYPTI